MCKAMLVLTDAFFREAGKARVVSSFRAEFSNRAFETRFRAEIELDTTLGKALYMQIHSYLHYTYGNCSIVATFIIMLNCLETFNFRPKMFVYIKKPCKLRSIRASLKMTTKYIYLPGLSRIRNSF